MLQDCVCIRMYVCTSDNLPFVCEYWESLMSKEDDKEPSDVISDLMSVI